MSGTNYLPEQSTNKTHDSECEEKDPLNLIFEGSSLKEIGADLGGWINPIAQHAHHLHMAGSKKTPKMCKSEGDLFYRHHIRLWDAGLSIIGNVHLERFSLRQGNHVVLDWDGAKMYVAGIFKRKGWEVSQNEGNMNNSDTSPPCDGTAAMIRRKR